MEQWKDYTLGECATLLSGGTPSKSRSEYWGGELPWVSCKDMKVDRIYDAEDHLTPEGAANGTRVVPEGTILFVVRGMILARDFPVAITKRRVAFNQDLKAVKPAGFVEPQFLYYWLKANTHEILGRADEAGHGTKRLQTDRLLAMQVQVPSITEQRRVASILAAYDDLIDNSNQRIRVLEEIARAVYREWFVEFRSPNQPRKSFVVYPPTSIPKGWEAIPFEKLLSSMMGGDWGSERPAGDELAEVGIVRGTDFDEVAYGGELRVPVRYIKPSSFKSRGLRAGDVIVENSVNAKSRCVGTPLHVDAQVLARMGRQAIAASFCKVFRFHEPSLGPVAHLHLRHMREEGRMEYYQNIAANGIGNFQAQKFAKEERLVLPADEKLRANLVGKIGAFVYAISLLASQIQNLRRSRDLLLPHLVLRSTERQGV